MSFNIINSYGFNPIQQPGILPNTLTRTSVNQAKIKNFTQNVLKPGQNSRDIIAQLRQLNPAEQRAVVDRLSGRLDGDFRENKSKTLLRALRDVSVIDTELQGLKKYVQQELGGSGVGPKRHHRHHRPNNWGGNRPALPGTQG